MGGPYKMIVRVKLIGQKFVELFVLLLDGFYIEIFETFFYGNNNKENICIQTCHT